MTSGSILGTISGTSADGIDLALIESNGSKIDSFGPAETISYRSTTRDAVLAAAATKGLARENWPEIAKAVTLDHVSAIRGFLERHPTPLKAVVFHGQTVWHNPKEGETVQLGDAQRLADELSLPVIGDVRLADMAAGGQGAPLVPVYHRALAKTVIGSKKEPICFLNIGGVSNLTFVSGEELLAFDIGPGNALLDDWVRHHGAGNFDKDGSISASGRVDNVRLQSAMRHPFLKQPGPKSLDRYSFSADFVEGLSLEDGAATLLSFTVEAIRLAEDLLPQKPKLWLVCGGGRLNPTLMRILGERLSGDVVSSDAFNVDGNALEAQAMAFLGARCLAQLPTTYPQTTGAKTPVIGGKLYFPRP